MADAKVKYCEDCRWFKNGGGMKGEYSFLSNAACMRTMERDLQGIELVGRIERTPERCFSERTGYGNDKCGKEAKFFEPVTFTPAVAAE